MPQTVKGKRILKNGRVAGYVLGKDKTWRWRFISSKKFKGGSPNNSNSKSLTVTFSINYGQKFVRLIVTSNDTQKSIKNRILDELGLSKNSNEVFAIYDPNSTEYNQVGIRNSKHVLNSYRKYGRAIQVMVRPRKNN